MWQIKWKKTYTCNFFFNRDHGEKIQPHIVRCGNVFPTYLCSNCQWIHLHMIINIIIYELTISFLIGWKRTLNFRNQCLWCYVAADYTIIMSRTLKVMGNYVMFARFSARVINLSFCLQLNPYPNLDYSGYHKNQM